MPINNQAKSSEIVYNQLSGYGFSSMVMYDEDEKTTIAPEEARFFYVKNPEMVIEVDPDVVSMELKEKLSDELWETVDTFRRTLNRTLRGNLTSLEFTDHFGATTRPKKDIGIKHMDKIGESKFSEITGSAKTSYQNLENVKLVIKHRKPVNEEIRGARSRNISRIYLQRMDERFRLPTTNLKVARAAARHISNGGEIHDTVCENLWQVAEDLKKLREFVRYARNSAVLNEQNSEYVEMANQHVQDINQLLHRMGNKTTYASSVEKLDEYVTESQAEVDVAAEFQEIRIDPRVQEANGAVQRILARRKQFQESIMSAIRSEKFSTLTELLHETSGMEFETPHARLGHQVAQLSASAGSEQLKSYLGSISSKLCAGESMNQFEYRAVKASLLAAGEHRANPVQEHTSTIMQESVEYQNFLEKFQPEW